MFRILITFLTQESLLFTTRYFNSLDQIEQRFLEPMPWVFQTEKGPVTVECPDIEHIVIQEMKGNRIIKQRTLTHKRESVSDEGQFSENDVIFPTKEEGESLMEEILPVTEENTDSTNEILPEAEHKEDIMSDEKVIIPEVMDDTPNPITALVGPAYVRFTSFREKFLNQTAEASSWEDQIVQKQADYIEKLKRVHKELLKRETDARVLEEKVVGK